MDSLEIYRLQKRVEAIEDLLFALAIELMKERPDRPRIEGMFMRITEARDRYPF